MTLDVQARLHKAECFRPFQKGDTCVMQGDPEVVVTLATDLSCRLLADYLDSQSEVSRKEFLTYFNANSVVDMLIRRQRHIYQLSQSNTSDETAKIAVGGKRE